MDVYSEVINQRDIKEHKLEKRADALLCDKVFEDDAGNTSRIKDMKACLEHIIMHFGMERFHVGRAESVEELIEMMLVPHGIIYEKVEDIEKNEKQMSNRWYLAETSEGQIIAIKSSAFGIKYYSPRNDREERLSKKIKIKPNGYEIFEPLPNGNIGFLSLAKYIFMSVPTSKITLLVLYALLITLLGLLLPAINRRVLDTYVPMGEGAARYLFMASVAFVVIGLVSALIQVFRFVGTELIRNDGSKLLQSAVMLRVLGKPISFFRELGSGKISTYVMNARNLGMLTVDVFLGASISTLFSLIYIPQMARFASKLVVPAIFILLIQILLSVFASILYSHNQKEGLESDAQIRNMMFTIINGVQKIKIAGAWRRAYAQWAKVYNRRLKCNHDPVLLVKFKPLIGIIVPFIGNAFIIIVATRSGVKTADYIAFTTSYSVIASAVGQLCSLIDSISSIKPTYEQLLPILRNDSSKMGTEYVRKVNGTVRFENIYFSYNDENAFSMNNLSLSIQKGEMLGIVGESGSGKSTLVNMIVGVNVPDSGKIYIDKKPLDTLNMQSLCKKIGYVSQAGKLFPGTVRYNVSLGNDSISDDSIWEALDLAAIGDYIRTLPEQLDTVVSETSNGGFSGGQKQCIMLARAFARNPGLLILDEATSALDNNTQKTVLENVEKMKCTKILVAHRLSTIKNCHRIIVIENGDIVEKGTYDELMALGGKFTDLVKKQEM